MDPSYYNPNYGQRYAPSLPPSPSPHPQTHPENPNFYGEPNHNPHHNHHPYSHHHHHQVPPLPPPPPQPPINQPRSFYYSAAPPLPPQNPPYNTLQFTYESQQISQPSSLSSSSDILSQDVSQSPRVGYQETRPGSWEPGASTGYNYQFDYSRFSTDRSSVSFRQGLESNSRFRDEFSGHGFAREEFGMGRLEDNYHSRVQCQSDSHRSSRVLGVENWGFESNSCCHDKQYGYSWDRQVIRNVASDGMGEKQRWVVDSEVSNVGGARFFQKKDDYYHSEIEKYFHEGPRERSNELKRTPRKQVQKKSALLRIQAPRPNQRTREIDRCRYSCQYDQKKSGSLRGKDQVGHSDRELVEKQRERPPMDLDVSFKSNALVAKAIKTPTSTVASSGVSVTPRSSKIRRILVADKDNGTVEVDSKRDVVASGVENKCDTISNPSSNASEHKIKEEKSLEGTVSYRRVMVSDKDIKKSVDKGIVKLDTSMHVANNASSSEKALKQSKEEVGLNISDGKITAEKSCEGSVSDKRVTISDTSEFPLSKVVKKRKVVKKVVKKAAKSPKSPVLQSREKLLKLVEAGNSCHATSLASESENVTPCLEKEVPFARMPSTCSVGPQHCANEVSENDKKNASSKDLLMKEIGVVIESGKVSVRQNKRKWNESSSPVGSLGHGEVKIDKTVINTETLSNKEEVCDQSLTKSSILNIGKVEGGSEKIHQKEDLVLPENDASKDHPKDLFSLGGNTEPGSLISEDLAITNHLISEMNSITSFESFDRKIFPGIGKLDLADNLACENKAIPLVESDSRIGSSESSSLRDTSIILPLQCSAKLNDNPGPLFSDCCNYDIDTTYNSISGFSNAEETNHKLGSDAGREACVNESMLSTENVARVGSLDLMPNQGIKEDKLNIRKNREAWSCKLDLPKAISGDTFVMSVNVDSSAYGLDTSLKNSCPAESAVADTVCMNDASNPCVDRVSYCPESKLSLSDDINVGPTVILLEREAGKKVPSLSGRFYRATASVTDSTLVTTDIGKSGVEMVEYCPQQEDVRSSYREIRCSSSVPPFSDCVEILLENKSGCASPDAMGSVRDSYVDGHLINDDLRVNYCVISGNFIVPCPLSPSRPEFEQVGNRSPVRASSSESQDDLTYKGRGRNGNMDLDAAKEKLMHSSDTSECRIPGIDSGPINSPCDSFFSLSGLGIEQIRNETPVAARGNSHDEIMGSESNKAKGVLLDGSQEQTMSFNEVVQSGNSLEHHPPYSGQTSPVTDSQVKSDEPPVSNYHTLPAYQFVVHTHKSSDDSMARAPDTPSDTGPPENVPGATGIHTLNCETKSLPISDERSGGNDKTLYDNYGGVVGSDIVPFTSHSNASIAASGIAKEGHLVVVAGSDSKIKSRSLNSLSQETYGRKNNFNYDVRKSYSGSSSFVFAAKTNVNLSTRITKPRTWHRSNNASASPLSGTKPLPNTAPTQRQLPNTVPKVQTSYIRKGNSLLRKSAPGSLGRVSHGLHSSTHQLSDSTADESKNRQSDVNDTSNLVKTGGTRNPFERQLTPPVDSISKVSNRVAISPGQCTSSPGAEPPTNGCPETIAYTTKPGETDVPDTYEDGLKASETLVNQTGYVSDCQEGNAAKLTSNPRKIVYVKRKSNQLVAASNVYNGSKTLISSSDGYYKRRKNQLVRTSDSHIKQAVSSPEDALNARMQGGPKIISKRNYSVASSDKAVTKPFKRSKFSLVWTLDGTQLTKTNIVTLQCQKILPQLFPWKRPTYGRSLRNSLSVPRINYFSSIGRKLLLRRKRHTVYTRSIDGYSLRKSKVLSIGGSHLKWSKSIERDSKKANEEATLAVAAEVKKKREHHTGSGISGTKNRSHFARERIFRIGSVRYKMDPSRRTLQRISGDESPCSGAPGSGNDANRSFIPRRLVIGHDEYVRVGNGNQLVRDPKKRTRALASEKVRWSLHTARMKLAKKRKYCQFFTRFGKCNKGDGKCPYIHDPSKIAVCTKFLNGLCANPNCKLTHKVIPERMPDCSYFLQGLCNNETCSYRHVHVNPNAATCEGFLRGYCADGNECQKKHTYTCPSFEATGSCPKGSKCKLHHPKKTGKGKKRKRSCEPSQKNARGRYFGSLHNNIPEPESSMVPDRKSNSDVALEGEAADYISLDVSENETEEINDEVINQAVFGERDASDMQFVDMDGLIIKPIGIMDKNGTHNHLRLTVQTGS